MSNIINNTRMGTERDPMAPENGEIGYFTQIVSEKLDVTRSKLRRLTTSLEKHGYVMTRNDREQRIYFDKDIQAIQRLLGKMRDGRKIEDAAGEVCGEMSIGAAKEPTDVGRVEQCSTRVQVSSDVRLQLTADQLRLMVEQVAATTAEKTANKVIEKYDRSMERRIELRDKELVSRLREIRDGARGKKHKKGLVSRLFSWR